MLDVTAVNEIADDTRARANVVRLAAAQALTGANSAVIFATGAIVGATLAPDISFATVPISMYVVGLAAGTLPTGAISRRFGRRVAFVIGTGLGTLTGLLGSLATLPARERRVPLRDLDGAPPPPPPQPPACARGRGAAANAVSANSPFAHGDGAAAARAPLERRLLNLNVERDLLDSELAKLPLHARTYADRARRRAAEDRMRDLDAAANQIKFALRSTAPL